MTQLAIGIAAIVAVSAVTVTWWTLTTDTGDHAAPRGRATITWDRTIPVRATRNRPPWEDLGPRNVRPARITPGGLAAQRAAAAWLVREADWRAEAAATRPWQDDTGTFAAIGGRWAA